MELQLLVNKVLQKLFNLQLRRYQPRLDDARRYPMNQLSINKVIDGGANRGQWTSPLIDSSTRLEFFSFEPMRESFDELKEKAEQYANWHVFNYGLGDKPGRRDLRIASNNGMSSSLFVPTNHLRTFPSVVFDQIESVEIVRLDDIELLRDGHKYLKLDVQGAEYSALKGSEELMSEVRAIEIETAITPMYEGEKDFSEMISYLKILGFKPFHMFTPAIRPTGQCDYVDLILISESQESLL
jgi:FkbM family methyltransferase